MAYTSGSPVGSNLEIGIALVLQDRFSNQAREASSAIKALHRDAKMAVTANLQSAGTLANQVESFAKKSAAAISRSVLSGAEFLDTMTTVGAITGASDAQMKMLGDTAQSLGLKTMLSAQDVASGMKYLAMAGNTAQEINDRIKGAAYVAVATGLELGGKGGAADMITNVMRAFRIEGEGAAETVGDILTKATMSANTSMTDMAEAIRYSMASMVGLKQELPKVSAMIGVLGNAGIQGSMAGTALDNMARYFVKSINKPSFNGYKRLVELGVNPEDFKDSKGDLKDFSVIMEKIRDAMKGLDSSQQTGFLVDVFGARGQRAASAIMNDIEGYRKLLNTIENESEGFALEIANKRMETLAGAINTLTSSLENFRAAFAESLGPVLIPVFKMLAGVVDFFRKVFAVPVLGTIISSVMLLGTALLGVGAALMKIRVKWLLLKNDSQVTGRNMFALLMGGWDGARLKAERYLAVERAIIDQRKGGIGASIGGIMLGSGATVGAKNGQGGVRLNSAGKFIDAKTGRFVSAKVAMQATGTVTAAAATKALMGGAAKRVGAGLALRGIGASLGRLVGFLGGPWGIAISAIITLVPLLISALGSNKEAVQENTASVYTLAGMYETEAARIAALKDNDLHQEMRQLINSLSYWSGRISSLASQKPPVYLTINNKGDVNSTVEGDDVRLEAGVR